MSNVNILVVRPKSLRDVDKSALRKAGVVVVEMDDPEDFKFIRAQEVVNPVAMLSAAMKALTFAKWEPGTNNAAEYQRQEFVNQLARIYEATENP